jgi:dTDP-4-amino-4,6-dideoxygalactose transaminase
VVSLGNVFEFLFGAEPRVPMSRRPERRAVDAPSRAPLRAVPVAPPVDEPQHVAAFDLDDVPDAHPLWLASSANELALERVRNAVRGRAAHDPRPLREPRLRSEPQGGDLEPAPLELAAPLVDDALDTRRERAADAQSEVARRTTHRSVPVRRFESPFSMADLAGPLSTLCSGRSEGRMEDLEARFCELVGARHAVAVQSAPVGLGMLLEACEIEPGDAVALPTLAYRWAVQSVIERGARPLFIDVTDHDLTCDPDALEDALWPGVRAVVVPHGAGHPADMERIRKIAAAADVCVIEEAYDALGAARGEPIGARGAAVFALPGLEDHPVGCGGIIAVEDPVLRDRLERLRATQSRRISSFATELGCLALARHARWQGERAELARVYRRELARGLPLGLRMLESPESAQPSHQRFVVRVPERDAVVARLREAGIEAGAHHPANHLVPRFAQGSEHELPVAEQACAELLSLPLHLGMRLQHVEYVAETLLATLEAR